MKHVPTVLFQTVEWSELTAELPRLSKRMLTSEGHDALLADQKKYLAPLEIKLGQDKLHDVKPPSAEDGRKLLELYFAQIFSPHGVFLDLRSHHFLFQTSPLIWTPSSLWVKFDPKFREGMLLVYEGFYLEDDSLFRKGLSQIGLLSFAWPEEDQARLCQLFESQFRSADSEQVEFTLEHLKNSLVEMCRFLLSKKVIIHKDFLYLGVHLVTLYSTLEQTKARYPVKDIYLRMRELFK